MGNLGNPTDSDGMAPSDLAPTPLFNPDQPDYTYERQIPPTFYWLLPQVLESPW